MGNILDKKNPKSIDFCIENCLILEKIVACVAINVQTNLRPEYSEQCIESILLHLFPPIVHHSISGRERMEQ